MRRDWKENEVRERVQKEGKGERRQKKERGAEKKRREEA